MADVFTASVMFHDVGDMCVVQGRLPFVATILQDQRSKVLFFGFDFIFLTSRGVILKGKRIINLEFIIYMLKVKRLLCAPGV